MENNIVKTVTEIENINENFERIEKLQRSHTPILGVGRLSNEWDHQIGIDLNGSESTMIICGLGRDEALLVEGSETIIKEAVKDFIHAADLADALLPSMMEFK